jgi:transposase-like protein
MKLKRHAFGLWCWLSRNTCASLLREPRSDTIHRQDDLEGAMAYEIPRHHYSSALKREAVQRVRLEGKPVEQVARELGLSASRLAEWLDGEDHASDLGALDGVLPLPQASFDDAAVRRANP